MSEKLAGIYMIRNINNGKVYIGATGNIHHRFKVYMHAIHRGDNGCYDAKRPLMQAIYEEGWDNFEFKILEFGPEFVDESYRAIREIEYIMKYRSILPEYGYNSTMGGECGKIARNDKLRIRRGQAKYISMFKYDTLTGYTSLHMMGAKVIAKEFGQTEMTLIWSVRNGSISRNRYYVFYANPERRQLVYDYVKACRLGVSSVANGNNSTKAIESFDRYQQAFDAVNEAAKEFGMGI